MKYNMRSYQGAGDQRQMISLACQCRDEHLHVVDLPYRFSSWALDDPLNGALWFNPQGELAAWAVLQSPFWTIDYTISTTAAPHLHAQVLAWADHRARQVQGTPYGRPCWFVMAFSRQVERHRDLEQAGFACQADVGEDSWSKVLMRREGSAPVKVYQPRTPGFTVRPLAGEAEVDAYVRLHQDTFESKNMTVDWRRRTLQQPAYTPEIDLLIEAPGGRLAAFCIGWLDVGSGSPKAGHIEPLGCHTDFRPYALGRVALTHTLQRLQELGAETILVETDNYRDTAFRLYQSVGFQVQEEVWVFRKDYPAPG